MSLSATQSSGVLETAGERATKVSLEDLAIGKFNQPPRIVSVAILGQVAIDGLLAKGDDSVDLLFGVREARLDIQQVSSGVNLKVS